MIKMAVTGLKETSSGLRKVGLRMPKDLDLTLKKGANSIMKYAKTKRFRKVANANKQINGELVNPPVDGILTQRTTLYARRISPPIQISLGNYEVQANVPYAEVHEDDRPVLTAALEEKGPEIIKNAGKSVDLTIERAGFKSV